MKNVVAFLFVLVSLASYSQVDYDKHIANYAHQNIDEKISTIFLVRGHLGRTDPDKIVSLLDELEQEANGQNRYDALAFFDYYWAGHLVEKSLLNDAFIPLERALNFFQEEENDTMLAEIYNLHANIEHLKGNHLAAEKHYLKSATHGKASGVDKFELFSLNNYAKLLLRLKRYNEAKEAIELFIDFFEIENEFRSVSNGYAVLANIYQNLNKPSEAIYAYEKSLTAAEQAQDPLIQSNGETNIAIAYFLQEKYPQSLHHFKTALTLRKKVGIPLYISQAYHNLGDYFQSLDKLDSALVYYEKALTTANDNDLKAEALDAYQELAATYEYKGQHEKANTYLKTYIEKISLLQREKNDNELYLLKRNQDFKLQRERILGDKREVALKSKVTDTQKIWRNWIWIVAIGSLFIIGILLRGRRKR